MVGDDSTGVTLNAGETIKIAGAGSITTAVSGDTITITGTGGGTSIGVSLWMVPLSALVLPARSH